MDLIKMDLIIKIRSIQNRSMIFDQKMWKKRQHFLCIEMMESDGSNSCLVFWIHAMGPKHGSKKVIHGSKKKKNISRKKSNPWIEKSNDGSKKVIQHASKKKDMHLRVRKFPA